MLRKVVQDYGWIHLGIGILGHTCFTIGSVFFLWESLKRAGIWLFIVGAAGMLIGKVGSALAEREAQRLGIGNSAGRSTEAARRAGGA